MLMSKAMDIINKCEKPEGFMVNFEWIKGIGLLGDYFPEKHAGERLIETEEVAWDLAARFALRTKGRVVNIYVTDHTFSPVPDYKSKEIKNR